MITREELLRNWLRGKGYHPNDIAVALDAYAKDNQLEDVNILKIADDSHKEAVILSREAPHVVFQQIGFKLVMAAMTGSFIGSFMAVYIIWMVSR